MSERRYRVQVFKELGQEQGVRFWGPRRSFEDARRLAKACVLTGAAMATVTERGEEVFRYTRRDLVEHVQQVRPDLVAEAGRRAALARRVWEVTSSLGAEAGE